jgi:hypothetical protein
MPGRFAPTVGLSSLENFIHDDLPRSPRLTSSEVMDMTACQASPSPSRVLPTTAELGRSLWAGGLLYEVAAGMKPSSPEP